MCGWYTEECSLISRSTSFISTSEGTVVRSICVFVGLLF